MEYGTSPLFLPFDLTWFQCSSVGTLCVNALPDILSVSLAKFQIGLTQMNWRFNALLDILS